jgi:hypothetical protein
MISTPGGLLHFGAATLARLRRPAICRNERFARQAALRHQLRKPSGTARFFRQISGISLHSHVDAARSLRILTAEEMANAGTHRASTGRCSLLPPMMALCRRDHDPRASAGDRTVAARDRHAPPGSVPLLQRAESLLNQHQRDTELLTLDTIAREYRIHPRTLRAPIGFLDAGLAYSYGVLGRFLSCFLCSSCCCFFTCCCLPFSLSFLPPLSPMPAPFSPL